MPDVFLASLSGKVVFSHEHLFVISGDSIADSVASFRACSVDPLNPGPPWPAQGWG